MTDRQRPLDEPPPVAYRMPDTMSKAEDAVHETRPRVHPAPDAGEQTASPRAFDATVTTRPAINERRTAQARRQRYAGQRLPEPIITET
jgi:DNA-directed RNA polymerase specialized sigma24 family protein